MSVLALLGVKVGISTLDHDQGIAIIYAHQVLSDQLGRYIYQCLYAKTWPPFGPHHKLYHTSSSKNQYTPVN